MLCGLLPFAPIMPVYADMGKVGQFQTISVGSFHSLTVREDGGLWAWGANNHGELGDGTTVAKSLPVWITDGVAAVSAGRNHTMAIKTDGSLWAWGRNNGGQLGDGTGYYRITYKSDRGRGAVATSRRAA